MQGEIASRLSVVTLPLYAIVDGASDRSLISILSRLGLQHVSLYDGQLALRLAHASPMLVSIPRDAEWLRPWLAVTWGRALSVYLSSDDPFVAVREHLQRFLVVALENNSVVHFRFYDPRVLRRFIPTCTEDERLDFFGPIHSYYLESDDHELLVESSMSPLRSGGRDVQDP